MEIFKDFGVDVYLMIAQIVNFIIIFYLLKKLLYKPVLGMLKKREDSLREGLQKAEEGKKVLELAREEERKVLKKAQETARVILEDAKEHSRTMLAETEEKARRQTERMLAEARLEVEKDVKEAERRLKSNITELSVDFLKKSLMEVFEPAEQEKIINKAVKKLKKPN